MFYRTLDDRIKQFDNVDLVTYGNQRLEQIVRSVRNTIHVDLLVTYAFNVVILNDNITHRKRSKMWCLT